MSNKQNPMAENDNRQTQALRNGNVPPIQLVISINPANGAMSLAGPIEQWWLCLDMLEGAQKVLKLHHAQQFQRQGIIAAPAAALDAIDVAKSAN